MNDTLPPPGLQRMVPGQLEQNEVGGGRTDPPPPGFSRMVLGQNENRSSISSQSEILELKMPIECCNIFFQIHLSLI